MIFKYLCQELTIAVDLVKLLQLFNSSCKELIVH